MGKTVLIETAAELFTLLGSAKYRVKAILDLGNVLRVTYDTEDDFVTTPQYTSLITGIMVTAYARLELLSYIHLIPEDDVLYFDTDSVIFIQKGKNNPINNIGPETGQMASELKGYGTDAYIQTFASSGPKSYIYKVVNPSTGLCEVICKFKGITIDSRVRREDIYMDDDPDFLFNFIKSNYKDNFRQTPIPIHQTNIRATARNELLTLQLVKKFGNDYDKRLISKDYKTLPWGYLNLL
jgi:hypothetical protein